MGQEKNRIGAEGGTAPPVKGGVRIAAGQNEPGSGGRDGDETTAR